MAGHSKWANIRRHKEKQDAKKGKVYTKLIRAITVSAKFGADPNDNAMLRNAIDKALAANMTRDVIDRAIKRGSGAAAGDGMEEVRYEGYGPYGIAIILECLTNNRNRTIGEIRHTFNKYGGNIGTDGSVAYLFNKLGKVLLGPEVPEALVTEIAIEANAEDIVTNANGGMTIVIAPELLGALQDTMKKYDLLPQQIDIAMIAQNFIDITDPEAAQQICNLLDSLEDLDDVQELYSNVTFSALN